MELKDAIESFKNGAGSGRRMILEALERHPILLDELLVEEEGNQHLPSLASAVLADPTNATAMELLGAARTLGAGYIKLTPSKGDGTPLCAFILLSPGPDLLPTLEVLDAIADEDDPTSMRKRVLAALDRLDSAPGDRDV
jgi:hypothetical protein